MTYKITKNGKDLVNNLTKEEATKQFFSTVENYASGYIYDNEAETIYHEVDGRIIANKGDEFVRAGNDVFEIEKEKNA